MKEAFVKELQSHGAVGSVEIIRSNLGARKTSHSVGWIIKINGKDMASARRPYRVFATLDTAFETLEGLGIKNAVITA